jgi:drug/metabolite transporter (DMT)-like permease
MTRAARLPDSTLVATLAVALTAIMFGLVPLFARQLQAEGVGAATIALARYLLSAIVLLPFLPLARAKRREALLIGGAGMALGLGWIAYLQAIEVAPIAAAGVIYMSYPLFCLAFAWLLLGQRPSGRAVAAGLMILLAAGLLLDPGGLPPGTALALLWSLPAPATFGFIVLVLCALTPNLTALEKLAAGMGGSALGLAPMALTQEPGSVLPQTVEGWAWIAGLGLVTALLPQLLYTIAAPRLGAARASAAGSFELPMMLAIGWIAFGETLGLRGAVASALVLAAIALSPAIRPAPPEKLRVRAGTT